MQSSLLSDGLPQVCLNSIGRARKISFIVQNIVTLNYAVYLLLFFFNRKLAVLRENFDMVSAVSGFHISSRRDLPSSSILDLANANQRLCDVVTVQLLGSAVDKTTKPVQDYQNLEQYTSTEKAAVQVKLLLVII